MTSTQVAALLATVGLAFLAQSIACAALFLRVRALARRVAAAPPTAEVSRPLADQLRAIEARLARLEAGPTAPAPDPRRTRRLDRRQAASADGPVLIAVPSLAIPPAAPASATAAAEFDRRFGVLWALADAGLGDDEIARQTGYPVGQVELIRGLRGPKPPGDPTRDPADA